MVGAARDGLQSIEPRNAQANRLGRALSDGAAWHTSALRWLACATTGLGALVLLVTMLQSFTVVRSFRAADQLVQDLANEVARVHLTLCELGGITPQTSSVAAPAMPPGDNGTVVSCAAEAQRGTGQMVMTPNQMAVWTGSTGPAARAMEAAADLQAQASHATERELWQSRSYALILLTSNLDVLFFAVAFGLVAVYVSIVSRARDSVVRARRAVARGEQHRANFLASAGHDLRQPIQVIELFLSTLRNRPLEADARVIIGKVESATGSMKRMISGLLDAAKLDAGMVSTDCFDVELDKLLSSIKSEFEPVAVSKGLRLLIEPTAVVVQTDPVLLDSILRNLLSNAIRYTVAGVAGIRVRRENQSVTLYVFDTGIGIPDEQREAVFEDFHRVNSIAPEGLGLGLGIVRRLCRLLHCEITVTSTVGEGSEFSLTLPIGRPSVAQTEVAVDRIDGASRATRVLLVEDNAAVRDALVGQLQCWGIEVIQAENGAEARAFISGVGLSELDMVIADFHLPDDNGLRLFKDLRLQLGRRPCLLITGATAESDLERIRSSGYVWLPKPVDLEKFRIEIQRSIAKATDNQHSVALSREL